jgi:hypothetical protein
LSFRASLQSLESQNVTCPTNPSDSLLRNHLCP